MATGKTIPSGFCSDGLGEEEEELQEDRPTLAITIKKRMAFSLIIKSKRASVSSYHFLILSSEDEKHFILNQKKYRLGKKEKISTGKRKKLLLTEGHPGPCWGSTSSFHWIPFEGKFKGNSMGQKNRESGIEVIFFRLKFSSNLPIKVMTFHG